MTDKLVQLIEAAVTLWRATGDIRWAKMALHVCDAGEAAVFDKGRS